MKLGLIQQLLQPTSMKMLLHYCFVTVMLLSCIVVNGNCNASSDTERLRQPQQLQETTMKDMIHSKLGRKLSNLIDTEKRNHRRKTRSSDSSNNSIDDADPYSSSNSNNNIKVMKDNTVLVDVIGNSLVDDMANELYIDGFTTINFISCYKHMCSMYVPIDKLIDIANLPYIQFVSPVQFKANAGNVTTEGDVAMFADRVRSSYNVNGTGLRICVLSDSFDCLKNAQEDIDTGDLPPILNYTDVPFCDIDVTPSTMIIYEDLTTEECLIYKAQDEGRSMMQIIHDIAPGAQLVFRTAYRGQADFASGIFSFAYDYICDVIVDDVTYFTEPFFQDGIVTEVVDIVSRSGILYLTAIGNAGRNSWETPLGFVNSTIIGPSADTFFHSYGLDRNGSHIIYQRVTIPNIDEDITFIFQWSEPYASATCECSNITNEVDLDIGFAVFNASSGVYATIASGLDFNVGYDPIEVVTFNPKLIIEANTNAASLNIFMFIQIYDGNSTDFMKVIVLSEYSIINVTFEFNTNGGSSTNFGHTNSRFGASVGAANFAQTPAFGVSPPIIEPYSTLGGTPIFFDEFGLRFLTTGGRRLASGQQRRQPRFAGPDGVSTTFKYKPPRKRFSGTSASVPHVAGTAALLVEATDGMMSPSEIFDIIAGSARKTGESDYDFSGGSGFVDAVQAFEAANVTLPPSPSCGLFGLSIFCLCGCGLFKRILGIGGC